MLTVLIARQSVVINDHKSIEVISFKGAVLKNNHHPLSLFYALQ
jgi:hypothetical protein